MQAVRQKYLRTPLLAGLRTVRGLSQAQLCDLAGVSEQTVRRAERDPNAIRDLNWRQILSALASISPLNPDEVASLSSALGWNFASFASINDRAQPRPKPTDGRSTARSRVVAVLDEYDDLAEPLAEVFESLGRLLAAARRPKPKGMSPEHLAKIESMMGTILSEVEPAPPDAQSPIPNAQPSPPGIRRVTLPAEQTKNGAIIERFEYYTEDGRRLVPAPPRAKKLDPKSKSG